ncbi:MAG: hypothetical protein M0Z79_05245 [Nitrospiraceae bacterium]|nr:hypothetical protein [Nitrospiraceae bacterium]
MPALCRGMRYVPIAMGMLRRYIVVLDVIVNNNSTTIQIPNPFRPDLDAIIARIEQLTSSKGEDITGLDVGGLIPRMIKGIAGCEQGCPANAKELVSRGYGDFSLQYIEGGILSANAKTGSGMVLCLKMFPEF